MNFPLDHKVMGDIWMFYFFQKASVFIERVVEIWNMKGANSSSAYAAEAAHVREKKLKQFLPLEWPEQFFRSHHTWADPLETTKLTYVAKGKVKLQEYFWCCYTRRKLVKFLGISAEWLELAIKVISKQLVTLEISVIYSMDDEKSAHIPSALAARFSLAKHSNIYFLSMGHFHFFLKEQTSSRKFSWLTHSFAFLNSDHTWNLRLSSFPLENLLSSPLKFPGITHNYHCFHPTSYTSLQPLQLLFLHFCASLILPGFTALNQLMHKAARYLSTGTKQSGHITFVLC